MNGNFLECLRHVKSKHKSLLVLTAIDLTHWLTRSIYKGLQKYEKTFVSGWNQVNLELVKSFFKSKVFNDIQFILGIHFCWI
jgi:hypothetical protein